MLGGVRVLVGELAIRLEICSQALGQIFSFRLKRLFVQKLAGSSLLQPREGEPFVSERFLDQLCLNGISQRHSGGAEMEFNIISRYSGGSLLPMLWSLFRYSGGSLLPMLWGYRDTTSLLWVERNLIIYWTLPGPSPSNFGFHPRYGSMKIVLKNT